MDIDTTRPRFAVGLPNVGIFGDPVLLTELAGQAERAGWDGVFLWDHVLYHDDWPVADPTVTIAAIAATTTRIRLGVLVAAVPRRRIGKLAREVASLDVLSGGRMVFGAGLGSMPSEYHAFGEPDDPRVRAAKLDESLTALDALWTGGPVTMHGEHVTVDRVRMTPTPLQRPRPPVWCAGRWPARAPFRRAARWDGVIPTHAEYGRPTTMPPQTLAEIIRYVHAHRAAQPPAPPPAAGAAGPPGRPFDVAVEGATDASSPDRGAATVRPYLAAGLTWWIEALGWWRGGLDDARVRVDAGPPRIDDTTRGGTPWPG
jgi:alkanesulfonate monooxygenase SsuD/methylene tetrahydromethanopterin reductase-like flavin-dependent oxidoreductase (luciferase family)